MALRRSVVVVLGLIVVAVFVSVSGMAVLYALVARGPVVQDDSTLVLRPGGEMPESAPGDVIGELVGRNDATVRGLIENLRLAKRDPRITNVLLMPVAARVALLGEDAGAARRGARLPQVGQDRGRVPRSRAATASTTWRAPPIACFCCRPARSI